MDPCFDLRNVWRFESRGQYKRHSASAIHCKQLLAFHCSPVELQEDVIEYVATAKGGADVVLKDLTSLYGFVCYSLRSI